MANVPSASESTQERIRGIVESYVQAHGREDDRKRAVEGLRSVGVEQSLAVIEKYRYSWENDPSVDLDRLRELESALRT